VAKWHQRDNNNGVIVASNNESVSNGRINEIGVIIEMAYVMAMKRKYQCG
jgi:hypothetical protein